MNVNDEFLKEFKRLDKMLSDAYGEIHGVTAYINHMAKKGIGGYDYQQLKSLRNVRNKLIHEVGYEDIPRVKKSDIDYLKSFYQRFLKGEDPLAKLSENKSSQTRALYILIAVLIILIVSILLGNVINSFI